MSPITGCDGSYDAVHTNFAVPIYIPYLFLHNEQNTECPSDCNSKFDNCSDSDFHLLNLL